MSDLLPVGEIEAILAERIVFAAWRLRRVVRLEATVIRTQMNPVPGVPEDGKEEERVYWAMIRDSNSSNRLERLRRYEVTLERSFFTTIHELDRLQRRRAGEQTSAPGVVDFHITTDD